MAPASHSKVVREVLDLTANGTTSINPGMAVQKVAITVTGNGGTPSAWDIDVDGLPSPGSEATAVEHAGHNSGAEALGATVNANVSGVVTGINVVLASLNLNGADALRVELVMLGY